MSEEEFLQPNLFASKKKPHGREAPLAERLRPRNFADYVGQEDIVAESSSLRRAIDRDDVPSVILWGPPGSGKTTLAEIIARNTKADFERFSAVVSGIPELRSVIKAATQRRALSGQSTILFVDEIHRFNKAQQDAFLPYVERGDITLIGATTQNPSFEIIAPLLSRSMIVVLQPLHEEALGAIVDRALTDVEQGLGRYAVTLTPDARAALIRYGNGDARACLNALEFAVTQTTSPGKDPTVLDGESLEKLLQQKCLRHDRDGEEHYNLISAFIKSMRDSDADGALYWLARMLEGGEDPKFIARRMVIFASEDIGNANPMAVVVATAIFHAVEVVGLPEAQINLAQGTTFLASCPKSNASYVGLKEALADAKEFGNVPVPLHLRNAVTSMMKELGYGKGYRYAHDDPGASQKQTHIPEFLKGRRYYRPQPGSQMEQEEELPE